jgi:hypothetical protein
MLGPITRRQINSLLNLPAVPEKIEISEDEHFLRLSVRTDGTRELSASSRVKGEVNHLKCLVQ